ncbi:unnamed protein product [Scytosiphon promiscuus]
MLDGGPPALATGTAAGLPLQGRNSLEKMPEDIERGTGERQGGIAAAGEEGRQPAEAGSDATAAAKSSAAQPVAAMRNLYTAAMSYNGYTVTDGALRLIVLLHAADLGFNAIEIAFMFSAYEVAGVFTNLFGGVAGSKYGLRCTLLTSLTLQIACLAALTQTEPILGDLKEATPGSTRYLEATIYITAWQALAGVAKDLMKLTGKATPKLVTKEGAEGRLFQLVAWLTGMKNALKGFGSFLGALLVAQIGYVDSLWILVGICGIFVPVGIFGMDRGLGVSPGKNIDWKSLFSKGRNVNVLSAARFFLFGSRDVWFEIGLPLFLRVELGWKRELVGLILAGYIVIYGNLQAASTKLYKNADGTSRQPTGAAAYKWAAYCSLAPLITGIATYFTHKVAESDLATALVLITGVVAFAAMFAVNSSVHSYLIVSYSNKDKVAMDLGFYYMANAMGRLVGVLVGGFLYHYTSDDFGLSMCLIVACPFLVAAAAIAYRLPDPSALQPPGPVEGEGERQKNVEDELAPPSPPVPPRDGVAAKEDPPVATVFPPAASPHAVLDDRTSAAPQEPVPASVVAKEGTASFALSQSQSSQDEEECKLPSTPDAPAFTAGRGAEPTE